MIVSIKEARRILGKEAKQYTDGQVEEIINIFTAMSDLAIDSFLEKKRQAKLARQEVDKEGTKDQRR